MNIKKQLEVLGQTAVFAKVIEYGSIKNAADALGRSDSSISRDIRALEAHLGVQVLHRNARQRCEATDFGKQVLTHGHCLLRDVETILDLAEQNKGNPRGLLRLCTTAPLARWIIQPQIALFLTTYPQIDLDIQIVDNAADLSTRKADIFILPNGSQLPSLVASKLVEVRYLLCATPEYLNRRGRPTQPADLADHECLQVSEGVGTPDWLFRRGHEEIHIKARSRYAVNSSELRLYAILAHLGIGCLPTFAAARTLASGITEQVLSDWTLHTSYSGEAWLCYSRDSLRTARVRAFVEYLRHTLIQISGDLLTGSNAIDHPPY